MTKLENIKYLRSIGASHKLMDDVAAKVGGYESPLFVPTVEFILKLQRSFQNKEQSQSQQVSNDLENTFDPAKFKGVDLESAAEVMQSSGGQKSQKKQAVAYIEGMVEKREQFLQQNPDFDCEQNQIPRRKKDKKQQVKQNKAHQKSNMISQLMASMKAAADALMQNLQNNRNAQQNSLQPRQQSQQNQQNQQQKQQVEVKKESKRRSVVNLLSIFKKSDQNQSVVASKSEQRKGSKEEFLNKLKKDVRIQEVLQRNDKISDKDLLDAAKTVKTQEPNATKDILISKLIDQVIKNTEAQKPDLQKNDKKQPVIDDAVAKLQSTGVKPITSADQMIDNKKALEDQQKIIAEQNSQIKR